MGRKRAVVAVAMAAVVWITGCAGGMGNENSQKNNRKAEEEPITLRVLSNFPDRTTGQGYAEQVLLDNYMRENKHVTIEVEALDDETYRTKFKAYASGSHMPDLVSVWGQPEFMDDVIDAGLLAELDAADYEEYDFLEDAFEGFSKNGKLYALPRDTNVACFYYREDLFQKYGWKVPGTYEELLELAGKIKEKGLIPVAMDGLDRWPLYLYLTDLLQKMGNESVSPMLQKAIDHCDFSDPAFIQSAKLVRETVAAGVFQPDFGTNDFGTAQNLFLDGRAAMFYMGSWDMAMTEYADTEEKLWEDIRIFPMPPAAGANPGKNVITAWNSAGYAVTEHAVHKEEAIKLLNNMMQPKGWASLVWESGACMPSQKLENFEKTANNGIQIQFSMMISAALDFSGAPIGLRGTSEFKKICGEAVLEMAVGRITEEEFFDILKRVK